MGTHSIAQITLRKFWQVHANAEKSLRAWHQAIESGNFSSSADVLAAYPAARSIGGSRIIFNLQGNQYRLVVKFRFDLGKAYVRFIGTHAEYDQIDATKI